MKKIVLPFLFFVTVCCIQQINAQIVVNEDLESSTTGATSISSASEENCSTMGNSTACPTNSCTNTPMIVSTDRARGGTKSLKMDVRPNNQTYHPEASLCSYRNEIRFNSVDVTFGNEAWYGFSIYPCYANCSGAIKYATSGDNWICQIKNELGSGNRGGVQIRNNGSGTWIFKTGSSGTSVELGNVNYDQWNDIVMHVVYKSQANGGKIEYWVNDAYTSVLKDFDTSGGNLDFKLGEYGGNPSGTIINYFDAIKVKKGTGQVSDVDPGGSVSIPAAPTGLAATAGNAQVSLSWTASSGATSYNVLRSTTSGSGYTSVATGLTSTSYTNTGLTNGTPYYFVVTATNSAGTSVNSSQASATPSAPSSLISESFTSSSSNFTVVRGGTWAVSSGKYVLSSAATTGTGNGNISIHNTAISGVYTLTADVTATPNASSVWDDCSVIFNYQDVNNYYFVSLNESNNTTANGIFKFVAGVSTELDDFSATSAPGTSYAIKVVRNGSSIIVYKNNIQIGSATDATFSSGKVGFGTVNDNASFDNLIVTSGVSVSSPEISDALSTNEVANVNVYPNPSTGRFSLSLEGNNWVGGKADITDAFGRNIMSKQITGQSAVEFDMSGNNNGIYMITVIKDGKRISKRIIKK